MPPNGEHPKIMYEGFPHKSDEEIIKNLDVDFQKSVQQNCRGLSGKRKYKTQPYTNKYCIESVPTDIVDSI